MRHYTKVQVQTPISKALGILKVNANIHTIKDFAQLLGINASTVGRVMRGILADTHGLREKLVPLGISLAESSALIYESQVIVANYRHQFHLKQLEEIPEIEEKVEPLTSLIERIIERLPFSLNVIYNF